MGVVLGPQARAALAHGAQAQRQGVCSIHLVARGGRKGHHGAVAGLWDLAIEGARNHKQWAGAGVGSAKEWRGEASARYEHTVLAALQDANSALSRYGHQREHVVRLEQVDASAQHASTLMRQRYVAGVATAIDLLDTERTEFSAQQDVVAGRAQLLKDFVLLQKSLGLGWQTQAS